MDDMKHSSTYNNESGAVAPCSGVTTVVASTAVLWGPSVLGGPGSIKNKNIVDEKCEFNNQAR